MAFFDEAWTLLRSDAPPSGFSLNLVMVRVILSWRSLKSFALLKEAVSSNLRANFPG